MINQIEMNCMKNSIFNSLKIMSIIIGVIASIVVIVYSFTFLFSGIRVAGTWLYLKHNEIFSWLTLCATTTSILSFWFFCNCNDRYYKLKGENSRFFSFGFFFSLLIKIFILMVVIIVMKYAEPLGDEMALVLPMFFIGISLLILIVIAICKEK